MYIFNYKMFHQEASVETIKLKVIEIVWIHPLLYCQFLSRPIDFPRVDGTGRTGNKIQQFPSNWNQEEHFPVKVDQICIHRLRDNYTKSATKRNETTFFFRHAETPDQLSQVKQREAGGRRRKLRRSKTFRQKRRKHPATKSHLFAAQRRFRFRFM